MLLDRFNGLSIDFWIDGYQSMYLQKQRNLSQIKGIGDEINKDMGIADQNGERGKLPGALGEEAEKASCTAIGYTPCVYHLAFGHSVSLRR